MTQAPLCFNPPQRADGYLPLRDYAALGDGRSMALVGLDGAIDWWGVPDMHAPPLFGSLWDAHRGGSFIMQPDSPFSAARRYIRDSNVLETIFRTADGSARLVESLNSGSAGRLPWCELARRAEGLQGRMRFTIALRLCALPDTPSSRYIPWERGLRFECGSVLGAILSTGGIALRHNREGVSADFTVAEGQRETIAIVAGQDEPLVIPAIRDIDRRIDLTHKEWRDWSDQVLFQGPHRSELLRHALALKLLLFSPTGAIAAAGTSSLPEKIGGARNYDYRFAWVRDASYVIKAFLSLNQQAEAKAAFTWLIKCARQRGAHVLYALDGGTVEPPQERPYAGYRHSRPVLVGNAAATQRQHGVYGDLLQVAHDFVQAGNMLDPRTAEVLTGLANQAAESWREPDSGIWECPQTAHYTSSKISCWQALDRAISLAADGHIPDEDAASWRTQRDAIVDWVNEHCWSPAKHAYLGQPECDTFDCSVVLGVRFGFPARDRLAATIKALDQELGAGPFHYRGSWSKGTEGCFLACSLWIILAKHDLGQGEEARRAFAAFKEELGTYCGILPEMIDPDSKAFLGNLPLGLTHLAMVQTLIALAGEPIA